MSRILVVTAIILLPLLSNAQQIELKQTPMIMLCGQSRTIVQLAKKLNLIELWKGIEDNGVRVTVWQDLKTKQFLISKQDYVTPTACIISMGGTPGI